MALSPKAPTEAEMFAAPWMEIALGELGKGIHEVDAAKSFQNRLYSTLSAQVNPGHHLMDWNAIDLGIARDAADDLGPTLMTVGNPEIAGYLATVHTDPDLDRHHRSFTLAPSRKDHSEWRMTAWCAAFVNWCLDRAGVQHLGIATAASWLKFGIPIATPTYGCIIVVKPGSSTGSTTGHVAFSGGAQGSKVWLLGGNQSRRVSWWLCSKEVLGKRWPGTVGDFDPPRNPEGTMLA